MKTTPQIALGTRLIHTRGVLSVLLPPDEEITVLMIIAGCLFRLGLKDGGILCYLKLVLSSVDEVKLMYQK